MPRKLEDVDVQFVSLVKRAANKRRFAIFKSADAENSQEDLNMDKSETEQVEAKRIEILREAKAVVDKAAAPAETQADVDVEKASGTKLLKEYMGIEDKAWREVEKCESEIERCEKSNDLAGLKKAQAELEKCNTKFRKARKARRMHEDGVATMKAAQTYLQEEAGEGTDPRSLVAGAPADSSDEKANVAKEDVVAKEEVKEIVKEEEVVKEEAVIEKGGKKPAQPEPDEEEGDDEEAVEVEDELADEEEPADDLPKRKMFRARQRLRTAKCACEDAKSQVDSIENQLAKAMDAGDDGLFERARVARPALIKALEESKSELEKAISEYEGIAGENVPKGIVENANEPLMTDLEDHKSIPVEVIDGSGEFEIDETGKALRIISSSPQCRGGIVKFADDGSLEIMKSALDVRTESIASLKKENADLKRRLEKREKDIQKLEKSDAVPTPRSARPDQMVTGTAVRKEDMGAGWGNGIDMNMSIKNSR